MVIACAQAVPTQRKRGMLMNRQNWLALLVLSPLPLSAMAGKPQSIEMGGFEFTPTLKAGERYDDNFRTLHDGVLSSWVTSLRPTFLLEAQTRKSAYQLHYTVDSETFQNHADASHVDQQLALRSVLEFDSRNRLKWELGYKRAEETDDTADPLENDKYTLKNALLGYSFGVQSGMNQIDLRAEYQQLRYRNSGTLNEDKEHDTRAFIATWYHRLGGRTRGLFELRRSDYDYVLPGSPRNSTGSAALIGLTRDVTARTSGSLRVGYERKDFDSDSVSDRSSPTWEVGLAWKPRTYSTFELNMRKAFDEGDDGASTVHTTSTRLSWTHTWSGWVSSKLDYRHAEREYLGLSRDDTLDSYGASLIYAVNRWAEISLGYRRWHNDSNVIDERYTRNVYLLSVDVSL
jgi:hypothetical protein